MHSLTCVRVRKCMTENIVTLLHIYLNCKPVINFDSYCTVVLRVVPQTPARHEAAQRLHRCTTSVVNGDPGAQLLLIDFTITERPSPNFSYYCKLLFVFVHCMHCFVGINVLCLRTFVQILVIPAHSSSRLILRPFIVLLRPIPACRLTFSNLIKY